MNELLPRPVANADSQEYWAGAREGRLMLRRCKSCGKLHFMPRFLCPFCWSEDLQWVQASGQGEVHSFTIVRRASSPVFAGRVPYVVALIDLAEGPRMMANILGPDALQVQIGDPVRLIFEERGEGDRIPQFERVSGRASA